MDVVFVSYKMQANPGFTPTPDLVRVPGQYKKAESIAAYIEDQLAAMPAVFAQQPYTGTFAEVQLCHAGSKQPNAHVRFAYRDPASGRQPACVDIRKWLLGAFPGVWAEYTLAASLRTAPPTVLFVGFDPKRFLRTLAIECSLPDTKGVVTPLPLTLATGDCFDLEDAVMPSTYCRHVSWNMVLGARGLAAACAGWAGPGADCGKDLELAVRLAAQLGVIGSPKK